MVVMVMPPPPVVVVSKITLSSFTVGSVYSLQYVPLQCTLQVVFFHICGIFFSKYFHHFSGSRTERLLVVFHSMRVMQGSMGVRGVCLMVCFYRDFTGILFADLFIILFLI